MTLTLTLLCALQDRGGRIEWSHDVERALAESRRSGRPTLLYFTADW